MLHRLTALWGSAPYDGSMTDSEPRQHAPADVAPELFDEEDDR